MNELTIELSGSITIGKGDTAIHRQVRDALDQGYGIIILDMEKVNYMDSAGVGAIAASFTSAKHKNAQFALTKLQPKIERLLKIMCFLDLIPCFTSNEDALQIMRARAKKAQSGS